MLNWWIKLYQAQNQFCTYSLERTKSLSKDKAQKMHLETLISPGPLYVILNKEQKKAPLETLYQLLNRDIACTGRLMISISILRTALPGLMITSKCLFMSLSQFTEKQMPRLSFPPLSFLLCNQLTSAKTQQYLLFAGILWSLAGSGGNFTYFSFSFSYWSLLLQKPPWLSSLHYSLAWEISCLITWDRPSFTWLLSRRTLLVYNIKVQALDSL